MVVMRVLHKEPSDGRVKLMLLSSNLLRVPFLHRHAATFLATLALSSAMVGHALGQAPYDNLETAEGWAWAQIKAGDPANFSERCGMPAMDARAETDTGWTDSCRSISAKFIVDILTRAPFHDQVPFAGVNIIGARVDGDINLRNAKLIRSVSIEQSRIQNNINLDAVRTDSTIAFIASRIAGEFSAKHLRAEHTLILNDSVFAGEDRGQFIHDWRSFRR
jgi:hypothetical protein